MNLLLRGLQPRAADASELLKSLAHPYRLLICCQLLDGPLEVGQLERSLDLKQPNLSRELGKLRNDGLIEAERSGNTVTYQLADQRIIWVLDGLRAAMTGLDTLDTSEPVKTLGSYWPYLTTAYDYIYRAMPFGNAQSLEPDEVYGILAYLLYMNDLVDDDFELSHENIVSFEMPNQAGFMPDGRPTTFFERCMTDCGAEPVVASRARVLDVTPDQ